MSDLFLLVNKKNTGVGVNVANASPTTSLNRILPAHLEPFALEKLLARILTHFEHFYSRFQQFGFSKDLEDLYYRHWLHRCAFNPASAPFFFFFFVFPSFSSFTLCFQISCFASIVIFIFDSCNHNVLLVASGFSSDFGTDARKP